MLGFVALQSKEKQMKLTKKLTAFCLAALVLFSLPLTGCSEIISKFNSPESSASQEQTVQSTTKHNPEKVTEQITEPQTAAEKSSKKTYTMADIKKLKNTENFAKNTLEHIFDGTINSKGKATGYHYSMVTDSKGSIIDNTRSAEDAHGVFTAKVEVDGVKKNGFSSFYPESWTPQQVVDAINTAYEDAISSPDNPQGSIWVGYCDDLEINMYLNDNNKITTAFPIYEGD